MRARGFGRTEEVGGGRRVPAGRRPVAPLRLAGGLLAAGLLALLPPAGARAQDPGPARNDARAAGVIEGRVIDDETGAPVGEASVVLRNSGPGGLAGTGDTVPRDVSPRDGAGASPPPRRVTTGADGAYRFDGLARGRYELTVERFGYRAVTMVVVLDRSEPLVLSVLLRPEPLPLARLDSWILATNGPSLRAPVPGHPDGAAEPGRRGEAVRTRQRRFLSPDVRQLDRADLREANTLAEDDLFRGIQRLPGVATRDDFSADLWTRGASAGQTAVRFDGIPLLGGLHALGTLGGLNPDMLASATFQPGVAGASVQGAGAGVVDVTSRSGSEGGRGAAVSVSPLSARVHAGGAWADRVEWAVGARRSWVDAWSRWARGVGPGAGALPYAFADLTGRMDIALGPAFRIEASVFWQDDRIFGDVPELAYGNEGSWGDLVARTSLVTALGSTVVRHTVGTSHFDASVAAAASVPGERAPLHPTTENHYRTLVWESRIDGVPEPGTAWSMGVRATREDHRYDGPGIDLARLLSPGELARRGIGDLTPVIIGLRRAHLLRSRGMTRVAVWGERRQRLGERLEAAGGLRVETGDRIRGGAVRLAPRLRVRYRTPGSPFSAAAAWGRAYQYVQTVARTDVVRPGLRASEILAQAGPDTPALRSDVVTLGGEAWMGSAWLLGATLWWRGSTGILVPDPTPGVIDGERPAVPATGRALGLELSARRLEGLLRGFASYSLSRSRQRVGTREFDASEDRRHVANLGVVADVRPSWRVGATLRAWSGAPYTRITLVAGECRGSLDCSGPPPVLYGSPGGQRTSAYLGVDLMTEWSHGFDDWTLSIYGQLRNAPGRANAITYHSSCVCVEGGDPSRASLRDRFDPGLPRLPVVGVRARFR